MSYRKHVIRQSLKFNVEEVADLQGDVREKLICLLDVWKLPPSRCYNCDETSVCLLLLDTRGWKDTQEQAMAATDGKLRCTVGLAIPMEFGLPWYSHIILKGTTPRSLPSAWPDNMLCACTETHWQRCFCSNVCGTPSWRGDLGANPSG